MMPLIYLLIIAAWIILIVGFYIEDYWIIAFGSMLLIVLGVYTLANGLEGIDNVATLALGAIHIGVGGYAFIKGMLEIIAKTW